MVINCLVSISDKIRSVTWPLPGGRGEMLVNVRGGVVMVIGQRVTMVMVGRGVVTWRVDYYLLLSRYNSGQYPR